MAQVLDPPFVPYTPLSFSAEEQLARAEALYTHHLQRRSVREFADRPVDRQVIEYLIRIAASGPTGANKQPYTFAVVSDPALKAQIREAAEAEERENYSGRFPQSWRDDLVPFGTDWQKPFLTTAPYLIVVFSQSYGVHPDGTQEKHYYVHESVGIAAGFLIAAIHHVGLVTLTHTPSPMNFLQKLLGRPSHEKALLLLPVGYAAQDVQVPNLRKKPLEAVSVWY